MHRLVGTSTNIKSCLTESRSSLRSRRSTGFFRGLNACETEQRQRLSSHKTGKADLDHQTAFGTIGSPHRTTVQ